MIRIGAPQQGHGSRRARGAGSASLSGAEAGCGPPEQGADLRDIGLATGACQQTVMPDAVEPVGQDVDQEPADELVRGEAHHLLPGALLDAIVLPAESDGSGVAAEQAAVRDRQAPEIRTTQGGTKITNFSLATSRPRLSEGRVLRRENGYRIMDTEWHSITCFNGLGKTVAEHCEKGMKVLVHGRIHYTKWIDSMGNDRYGCEIIAEKVDRDDEIPF